MPDVGLGGTAHIVYDRSAQRVWLIEADGTLLDTYPVSGRAINPLPGRYSVFSKSPLAGTSDGAVTMAHMVRFTHGRPWEPPWWSRTRPDRFSGANGPIRGACAAV